MTVLNVDPVIEQEYRIVRHIGSGAYGVVWSATERRTGTHVALKKVFDAFGNEQDAQRTLREVVLLQQLDHPGIVKLRRVIKATNEVDIYLVFELLEADLHTVLKLSLLQPIHEQYLAYQLLMAVGYLHHRGIVHRDLKPANVFLNSNARIKLGDFGLARSVHSDPEAVTPSGDLTDYVATRWYRAPEILLKSTIYTTSMDMWAIGCVLAEMVTGEPLLPGGSTAQQLTLITNAIGSPTESDRASLGVDCVEEAFEALEIDVRDHRDADANASRQLEKQLSRRRCPPDCIDMIKRLLRWSPADRLTAAEAVRHPFVAPFRDRAWEQETFSASAPPIHLGTAATNRDLSACEYRTALFMSIASSSENSGKLPPVNAQLPTPAPTY